MDSSISDSLRNCVQSAVSGGANDLTNFPFVALCAVDYDSRGADRNNSFKKLLNITYHRHEPTGRDLPVQIAI